MTNHRTGFACAALVLLGMASSMPAQDAPTTAKAPPPINVFVHTGDFGYRIPSLIVSTNGTLLAYASW